MEARESGRESKGSLAVHRTWGDSPPGDSCGRMAAPRHLFPASGGYWSMVWEVFNSKSINSVLSSQLVSSKKRFFFNKSERINPNLFCGKTLMLLLL